MLLIRLAWRNLRARPGQAAMMLVALIVATPVVSMAMAVDQTGNGAWERVWRATNGPDVVASAGYADGIVPAGQDPQWPRDTLAVLATDPRITAVQWQRAFNSTGEIGGTSTDLVA